MLRWLLASSLLAAALAAGAAESSRYVVTFGKGGAYERAELAPLLARLYGATLVDSRDDRATFEMSAATARTLAMDPRVASVAAATTAGGSTTTRTLHPDPATNRLAVATYDEAGNETSVNAGPLRRYDALRMLTSIGNDTHYIYTASDERLAVITANGTSWHWTLRGLDHKPLRELRETITGGTRHWTWTRDYVYRDGVLLGAYVNSSDPAKAIQHYHVDHLGTPRLITDATGRRLAEDELYPFGEDAAFNVNDPERLHFTGHERDYNGGTAVANADYLDYMHARYYSPTLGRFLSVDPVLESVKATRPQTWNRYAYAMNNPLLHVDPDGRAPNKAQAGNVDTFLEPIQQIEAANPRATPAQVLKMAAERLHHGADDYQTRYVYTDRAGWIDSKHFFAAANAANKYGEALTNLAGIRVELGQIGGQSFFSYEDIPSNASGAEFGDDVFFPDGSPLSAQAAKYLQTLGATVPEAAPNYSVIPDTPGRDGSSGGPGQSGVKPVRVEPCAGQSCR